MDPYERLAGLAAQRLSSVNSVTSVPLANSVSSGRGYLTALSPRCDPINFGPVHLRQHLLAPLHDDPGST